MAAYTSKSCTDASPHLGVLAVHCAIINGQHAARTDTRLKELKIEATNTESVVQGHDMGEQAL